MKHTVIATNPPIDCFRCPKCGYHYDSHREESETWIDIPLVENKFSQPEEKLKGWGLFKGIKIEEEDIEKAKNFGDPEKQGYIEKCNHNWVWYPDETSTWKFAGFWRCSKCGLFRFN